MSDSENIVNKYWAYYPKMILEPDRLFRVLLPQFQQTCKTYTINMYGKVFQSKKISCVYMDNTPVNIDAKSKGFNYDETPSYDWTTAPDDLIRLRTTIEHRFGYRVDYVLVHIYRGHTEHGIGKDYIGWHNDKEALDSEIFSVSLGAPRRFQFRPIDATKGFQDELLLSGGDVVHMFGPRSGQLSCQRVNKHRVPPMTAKDLANHVVRSGIELPPGRKTFAKLNQTIIDHDIAPTRINLTFRQFE